MADSNQRQDHRHLDGDSKHAQQCSDRPVTKIREYQFIEQDQILIEIKRGTNRDPKEFNARHFMPSLSQIADDELHPQDIDQ
jgi:hypothetical protein